MQDNSKEEAATGAQDQKSGKTRLWRKPQLVVLRDDDFPQGNVANGMQPAADTYDSS